MCPILFHSCPELFVFLPFFWVAWRFVSKPCLRPRSSSSVWRQSIRIQRRPGSPWILGSESRQNSIVEKMMEKKTSPRVGGSFFLDGGEGENPNKVGAGFAGVKSLLAMAIFPQVAAVFRCGKPPCQLALREASPPVSQFRQLEVNNQNPRYLLLISH